MKIKRGSDKNRSLNGETDTFPGDLTAAISPKTAQIKNKRGKIQEDARLVQEAKAWYSSQIIKDTLAAIRRNNMMAVFAHDKETALREVMKRIPQKAKVSHGGSLTIRQLGITEKLSEGDYNYERHESEDKKQRRSDFSSDIYLTSVNAITKDGRLIAIDGVGNRTAAIMYGPDKVIIIVGINKIVGTLEEGLRRIKEYVTPIHAKRRNQNLPCTAAAQCTNCRSKNRLCNKTMIIDYEREKGRITVILVGEELGI